MPRKPISQRSFKVLLLLSDILALTVFFNLAHYYRLDYFPKNFVFNADFGLVVIVIFLSCYVFDLYDPNSQISGLRPPGRFWLATLVASGLIALYLYLIGKQASNIFGRGVMAGGLVTFALWGSIVRWFLAQWLKKRGRYIRWLGIGNYEILLQFWEDFCRSRIDGQITFLVNPEDVDKISVKDFPMAGTSDELDQWLLRGWSGVVVCTDGKLPEDKLEKLLHARLLGLRVYNLTDFYEDIWFKVPVYYLDRSWLALSQGFGLLHNKIGLRLKRICDIVGALALIPIAVPLVILAGLLIFLDSGFPVIFRQTRTGIKGRHFTLYKLRTMAKDAETQGAQWAAINDSRITLVGKVLRKFRIDELPQLWNVLVGDMSFIGPRPERPEFNSSLEKSIPHYNLRHVVRPGITGWAQVLYRYGASVKDAREKLQYDLYYIKNYSFIMDVAIILKTLRLLIFGAGR